jgi:hypothetical protein
MAANFQYDEMLPSVDPEAKKFRNPKRQVEVYTLGHKLFLRIGAVNQKDSGEKIYTVQLTDKSCIELAEAIIGGANYLCWTDLCLAEEKNLR